MMINKNAFFCCSEHLAFEYALNVLDLFCIAFIINKFDGPNFKPFYRIINSIKLLKLSSQQITMTSADT